MFSEVGYFGDETGTDTLTDPSLELRPGMEVDEVLEVLMHRMTNQLLSPEIAAHADEADFFGLTPDEVDIVLDSLHTEAGKNRHRGMFKGVDTASLVELFLQQSRSSYDIARPSSAKSATSMGSVGSFPFNHQENVKILALRQPDPDHQTGIYPIEVVFLEETFSLVDEPKKYFPPLRECRYGGVMAYHNNYVYVIGGLFKGIASQNIARINVMEARPLWMKLEPMPHRRRLHAAAIEGDQIYVYGGLNKGDSTGWTGDCFFTDQNRWTTRAGMHRPRKEFSLVTCKGFLYAIGGTTIHDKPIKVVERYDRRHNDWRPVCINSESRVRSAAVCMGEDLYVIGGKAINFSIAVCQKKKGLRFWKIIFRGDKARWNCSACVLDKKIYVLGGFYNSRDEPANEINRFDPALRSWEVVGQAKGIHMNSIVAV